MRMISVMRAEDSLRHVAEIAAGNGLIPKAQREMLLAAWRRQARRTGKRKTTLAELSAPGLPIVEVRKGA